MVVEEKIHGSHFQECIVLQIVYWYLRYSLSYRDIEELMNERGIELDHATAQSERMDETWIMIKGICFFRQFHRKFP